MHGNSSKHSPSSPAAASTDFTLAPGTGASLRLSAGTRDPGWPASGTGFIRKDVQNEVWSN